jgi:hypothetical protein
MRRKPVTRDEVRIRGYRITTMPIDSCREDEWGDLKTSASLWAPLVRSLRRAFERDWSDWEARLQELRQSGFYRGPPPRKPYRPSAPTPRTYGSVYECKHCDRGFYRAQWARDIVEKYCCDRASKPISPDELPGPGSSQRPGARRALRPGLAGCACVASPLRRADRPRAIARLAVALPPIAGEDPTNAL